MSHCPRGVMRALVGAFVACLLWGGCEDPREVLILLPETMQRSGPQTIEPGGAIAFWGNGTLHRDVPLEKGAVNVGIVARGTEFGDEWPQVQITLSSRIVASLTVDSTTPAEYEVQLQVPDTATGALDVELVNHAGVPGQPLDGRNLLVQKITLTKVPPVDRH